MPDHADKIPTKAVIAGAEPQLFVADIKASCDFFAGKLGFTVGFTYGEFYLYMVLPPNEGRTAEQVWLRHMAKSRLEPTGKPGFSPDKPMEWDYKITPIPSGDPTYPFGYLRQIK